MNEAKSCDKTRLADHKSLLNWLDVFRLCLRAIGNEGSSLEIQGPIPAEADGIFQDVKILSTNPEGL